VRERERIYKACVISLVILHVFVVNHDILMVLVNIAGLKRCGKSCRLRWLNYLRPNIKHGEFSDDEDRIICSLFASIGSRYIYIYNFFLGKFLDCSISSLPLFW